MERVTGSIAFAALARVVLVAAKARREGEGEGESRRVLMRAKSNIGPDDGGFSYELERVEVAPGVEGQRVRWLEPLEGSARELLANAEGDAPSEDGGAGDGVDGFLLALLANGSMTAKEIKADADGAGYGWHTVQRAANRLGIERQKEGMRGGWVWRLPSDTPHRRSHEGCEGDEGGTQKGLSSSSSSEGSLSPSDDVEVI